MRRAARPLLALLLLPLFVAFASHAQTGQAEATTPDATASAKPAPPSAEQSLVLEAATLLESRQPQQALDVLDRAIAGYEARFADSSRTVYAARSSTEALMYMLGAASGNKDAIAVESEYSYAYYFKAYTLVELGRTADAMPPLRKAIELSPSNAQYLAELGNLHKGSGRWNESLAAYQRAETASDFSPDNMKKADRSLAWRGIGYAYIELGRLDEAQAMFERCLKVDGNDAGARNELAYIRKLRAEGVRPTSQ